MADKSSQFPNTISEILDDYFLAERHPRLEELAGGSSEVQGRYWVGYRYLDLSADPTINVETLCDRDELGHLIKQDSQIGTSSRWMIRAGVMDDWPAVALTAQQRQELGLPDKPDWVHFYEPTDDSSETLLQKGRALNSGGLCEQAIPILHEALEALPNSPRVAFELLYALNATKRFGEAIELVNQLPDGGAWSQDGMVFREIAFAFHQTGSLENAAALYAHAFELVHPADKGNRAEIAFNAGSLWLQQGDQEQGAKWWNIAWQLAAEGSPVHNQLKPYITSPP